VSDPPLPPRPLVPAFLLRGFADEAGQLMAERRDRTRRRLVTVDAVLAELGSYAVPPGRPGARELAGLLAEAEAAAGTAVDAMLAGTFPPPPAGRAAFALLVALQLLVAPRHRATAAHAAELVGHLIASRLDALEAAARGEDSEDEGTGEDAEQGAEDDDEDDDADAGAAAGADDGETEPEDDEAGDAPLAAAPPGAPGAARRDPGAPGAAVGRPAPAPAGGDLVLRTGRRRTEHSLASVVALARHVTARTWQLARFPQPVLLTSDTPVVLWAPSATAKPYHAGLGAADEIRVPLDSRHALIVARRARAGEIVRDLEERHARALNRTVAEAASEWIYYHPGSDPLEGVALTSPPSA